MSGEKKAGPDRTDDPVPAGSDHGGEPKRDKKMASRLAFGIGSAAIVAALLYAGRGRGKSSKRPPGR